MDCKTPQFDPRKIPVSCSSMADRREPGRQWGFRWNPQMYAAAGYVVIMPNPRGSTGYGQQLIDEINKDWGGRCFKDLMLATDAP